jgi:hypothetical protein
VRLSSPTANDLGTLWVGRDDEVYRLDAYAEAPSVTLTNLETGKTMTVVVGSPAYHGFMRLVREDACESYS